MAEPATLPLWVDLAAVGFGAAQGGVFAATGRDERNDFDILGVAVFALVVGLFVIVGALKTHDADLPGGAIIVLGALTGVGGGVLRDLLARRPVLLVQRSTPYALVALAGAATFVAFDTAGASRFVAAAACLVAVFALRMLALTRGWRSPAPIVGARRGA